MILWRKSTKPGLNGGCAKAFKNARHIQWVCLRFLKAYHHNTLAHSIAKNRSTQLEFQIGLRVMERNKSTKIMPDFGSYSVLMPMVHIDIFAVGISTEYGRKDK